MLQWMSRYQKVIFPVVTVIVIGSFVFFGTHSAMRDQGRSLDRKLGTAIDGTMMYQKEIDMISRFIETDVADKDLAERRYFANRLNDGFIRNDMLKSGIGPILYGHYVELLRGEVEPKRTQYIRYRPYQHPIFPTVSVQALWNQSMPKLASDFEAFKSHAKVLDRQFFESLADLYLDQTHLTPSRVRQLIQNKELIASRGTHRDPSLETTDLAIFGARKYSEWFGRHALELTAQFIHNAAIYAKVQGYSVSASEAKASLLSNAMRALKGEMLDRQPTIDDAEQLMSSTLHILGLSESDAIRIWQKILLTRRMFDDVGEGVLLDTLMYEEFNNQAMKEYDVTTYSLPSTMKWEGVDDMLEHEIYLSIVGKERSSPLDLPFSYYTPEELLETNPSLVQRRYALEVRCATQNSIIRNLSLKKRSAWQVEDGNWKELASTFPFMEKYRDARGGAREDALTSLTKQQRAELDLFAAKELLKKHPEWLKDGLNQVKAEKREVVLTFGGRVKGFSAMTDGKALMALLDQEQESVVISAENNDLYELRVLERSDLEIVPFKEAQVFGALREVLEERLSKHSFGGAAGEMSAKRKAFEPLFSAIEADAIRSGESLAGLNSDEQIDLALKKRFAHLMQGYLKVVSQGGSVANPIEKTPSTYKFLKAPVSIPHQWDLIVEKRCVGALEAETFGDRKLTHMTHGSFSSIIPEKRCGLMFYQYLGEKVNERGLQQEIQAGRNLLMNDAKRNFMVTLLTELSNSDSIHLEKAQFE